MYARLLALFVALLLTLPARAQSPDSSIPLPEHPRPDFERADWINLNGQWDFRFDKNDEGEKNGWFRPATTFPLKINVPFPWGSKLSGVSNEANIAWYARSFKVPQAWNGRRVFLVIGASDWQTSVWLDGTRLGTHQGGYTPFEFELTPHLKPGQDQRLVVRVDDAPRPFLLEGKQGYGQARGIWQTPYLEVRGDAALSVVHFTPDIDAGKVTVEASLLEPAKRPVAINLDFKNATVPQTRQARTIPAGQQSLTFDLPIRNARLWSLDDPFLYEVTVTARPEGGREDRVDTYFGMRKISVEKLPGTSFSYVALNNQPLYLQLALDQAYHPEGFYTFPSDQFMRDEILRARQIGLNGVRVHIKVEVPRKLYWADRLGLLIMADNPNFWGEPGPEARRESEYSLRNMIKRDYNHPSIFSWITFNETWGLRTKVNGKEVYLPETKEWVVSVYRLAKSLDKTRLVEDNSVCCGVGHTETDINSWHSYLPGWEWEAYLDSVSAGTRPGSQWNFEPGFKQAEQPNINSEFGNVWGYEGSTGDVDWSWDYHRAIDAFRRHPAVAGWLYTEHHDVINEWNGYWRYDRSEKFTGMEELVPGMTLRDFHAPLYVAFQDDLSREVEPGATVQVPLYASFMTGRTDLGSNLTLGVDLYGWDALGRRQNYLVNETQRQIPYRPWMNEALQPLSVKMPAGPAVAVLAIRLMDASGNVLSRNFTTFVVKGTAPDEMATVSGKMARLVRVPADAFKDAKWSLKQWDVLDGLKVNGAGSGYFEYRMPWPKDLKATDVDNVSFLVEASAKQLFGKDREGSAMPEGDYMRGLGTADPSRNPNAYPMTDETRFPSAVTVRANGEVAGMVELSDDPADHRGILSWHSQLRDRKLREAGSYGQLVQITLPAAAVEKAAQTGEMVIRLEVGEGLPGGLAIYGSRFGRYPVDPTLVIIRK